MQLFEIGYFSSGFRCWLKLYQNVAKSLKTNKIDRIITIGLIVAGLPERGPNVISFTTTQTFFTTI